MAHSLTHFEVVSLAKRFDALTQFPITLGPPVDKLSFSREEPKRKVT